MYANEIRELTLEEIEHKIVEAHQELFNLRFQRSTQQLKDYSRVSAVKREISRLQTIAREKSQG